MPINVLLISDAFGSWNANTSFGGEVHARAHSSKHRGVPSPDQLREFDYVVLADGFENESQATQLGGAVRLALEAGTSVICLFLTILRGALQLLTHEVLGFGGKDLGSGQRVDETDAAFHDFFGAYGRGGTTFEDAPADRAVVGTIDDEPAAIICPSGTGVVALLPYHVASFKASHHHLIQSALTAVLNYRSAQGDAQPPAFLDALELPGEEAAEKEIKRLLGLLEVERDRANRLARLRLLMSASGDRLEALVIDALNLILARTQISAEERREERVEDFWLVDSDGDRALAEAKGIGSNVRRQDINQVENHRAERERTVEDLPGLLIVNTFRSSSDLERRQLPVSKDVVRHAERLNVLVLRTWDLLELVRAHLGGEAVGGRFVKALNAGGGWLQVGENGSTLHQS